MPTGGRPSPVLEGPGTTSFSGCGWDWHSLLGRPALSRTTVRMLWAKLGLSVWPSPWLLQEFSLNEMEQNRRLWQEGPEDRQTGGQAVGEEGARGIEILGALCWVQCGGPLVKPYLVECPRRFPLGCTPAHVGTALCPLPSSALGTWERQGPYPGKLPALLGLHLTTGPAPLPCGFLGPVFRVGDEGVLGSTRALSLCEESQVGSGERWVGWVGFRVAMGGLGSSGIRTPLPHEGRARPVVL